MIYTWTGQRLFNALGACATNAYLSDGGFSEPYDNVLYVKADAEHPRFSAACYLAEQCPLYIGRYLVNKKECIFRFKYPEPEKIDNFKNNQLKEIVDPKHLKSKQLSKHYVTHVSNGKYTYHPSYYRLTDDMNGFIEDVIESFNVSESIIQEIIKNESYDKPFDPHSECTRC